MTNKIYIIDNIWNDTIKLKKIYKYDILKFLPLDIELIIYDYINDIIILTNKSSSLYYVRDIIWYDFTINSQYINNSLLSFTFTMNVNTTTKIIAGISFFGIDHNIISIVNIAKHNNVLILCNTYMDKIYGKKEYLKYYNNSNHITSGYTKNILSCNDHNQYSGIIVKNHRLFKNAIVIMKCIFDKVNKYLVQNH